MGRNEFPFAPYQYASAGLNTSLSDLSKWFELLLEGDLISRETLYQSWQPLSYNDGREAAYANGWESRSDGDIRIVGHIGGGRMNARHYFNRTRPEASVTVLFFTNGAKYRYNLEDVSDELVSILSPELIGPAGGLRQKILQRVAAKDWPAIEVLYAAFRQNPATIDISIEGVINQLAYAASFQPETVDIAVKLFELNVRDYPESANVYDSMGDGYFAAGHYEKARENYQKAYEMDPERFTHIPEIIAIFFTNGAKYRYNLEDVSDELVSILSPELIGPAGGLRQKILQRVAAKDWPAIEVLYAAFRQNPATIDISIEGVINQLAYAASFQPETVDIAVKLFELNVRDYPESANVYDSMGDGYFAAGHYEKARENYQKAYEMDPERFTHIPQRLAEIKTKLEKLKVQ